ncbi:MAG: hypothetical protein FWD09_08995 [Lentimicrobiaceae bacterium]|nr:hypothetical protein [Lentimicrobiaceae bacterium]
MKKHFILFVCCLSFVFSGMAQPEAGKISRKFAEKVKQEKLNKKMNLEKEKLVASQKQMLLSKIKTPTESLKSEDWWEPDTIYQYYEEEYMEEIRRIFSYEKGNCTVDLWQEREGNQWEDVVRYIYTYDLQDNITIYLLQGWYATQWLNEARLLYKYDAQNNMIEMIFQEYWNGSWNNEQMVTYAYDSQNKMTEALLQVYDGYWEDAMKTIFTYDALNNTTTIVYYWWENEQWEAEDRIILTYDTQNNLISEVWYWWCKTEMTFLY